MSVLLLLECGDNNKEWSCAKKDKKNEKKKQRKKKARTSLLSYILKKDNMNKWHKITEKKRFTNKQTVKAFFTRDI